MLIKFISFLYLIFSSVSMVRIKRFTMLILLISFLSQFVFQGIRSAYKKAYGSDLVEEIEKETSVNFKRTLVGLTEERFEYRARLLREAKRGTI